MEVGGVQERLSPRRQERVELVGLGYGMNKLRHVDVNTQLKTKTRKQGILKL